MAIIEFFYENYAEFSENLARLPENVVFQLKLYDNKELLGEHVGYLTQSSINFYKPDKYTCIIANNALETPKGIIQYSYVAVYPLPAEITTILYQAGYQGVTKIRREYLKLATEPSEKVTRKLTVYLDDNSN